MRKILFALMVVAVFVFAAYWMMQPIAARYPASGIVQDRANDPAFRAELAEEERLAWERDHPTTQPSTQPTR